LLIYAKKYAHKIAKNMRLENKNMYKPKMKNYKLDFRNLTDRDKTDQLVIHHTGDDTDDNLSAEDIHKIHLANGWAGIGYHYVIRKDGTIEIGRPVDCIGAHAEGENNHTIGIHLSGNFEIGEPTDAQIESTATLIAWLCQEYDIDINSNNVVGHKDLPAPAGETACPGKNLYSQLETIRGKAMWYQLNYVN